MSDTDLERRETPCAICGALVLYHAPADEGPARVYCLEDVAPGQRAADRGHTIQAARYRLTTRHREG